MYSIKISTKSRAKTKNVMSTSNIFGIELDVVALCARGNIQLLKEIRRLKSKPYHSKIRTGYQKYSILKNK